jgi:spermidine synthase
MFDDARNYMNMTRKQYDIIVSEPSNPWIAGVASLFTAEFYDRAAQVLKPDGVFAQWIQLYELDPEDLRMIMKEFQRKFPEVSAWVTGSDLMLIGTNQPQKLDVGRIARISGKDPSMMRDYREFLHMSRPEGVLAYYVMSTEEVRKFAVTERRNTDDHPLLEFHAPRRLFTETRDLNLELLYEAKGGLIPPGTEIPDAEAAYGAMIEPFLFMKRSNLANQAMGMLASLQRKEEASLHVAIARLNLDSNSYSAATDSLAKADASIRPGSPLLAEKEELWGVLYDEMGSDTDAMQHLLLAVAADPSRSLSLQKLAEICARNQDWEEAAKWMKLYIETRPQSLGHYWAMLGDYYLAAENTDEALKALQTAVQIDPYSYWARFRMARVFEQKEDVENAVEQYEFIVKYAFDRDADVYVNLATLYKNSSRNEDALRVLEKGHRIFPTNVPIYRLYQEVRGGD